MNLESSILAHNMMNGRYYAGKQITCEFVTITRWKMAICGEYMKSRLKTCSHGTACNFIHCFRNPGGDYEWADWDNHAPRYWIKKMAVLFGPSDGPRQGMDVELENQPPKQSGKKRMQKTDRYQSRRDRYEETVPSSSSGGEVSDGNRDRHKSRGRFSGHKRRSYSREGTKTYHFVDKPEQSRGGQFPEVDWNEHSRYSYESGNNMSKPCDRGSLKERESKEGSCIEDQERVRKRKVDSSSRSMRETTVNGERKSEKKSKHHRQKKQPDLLSSVDGSHKVDDGYQKDGRAGNKANYKYASDVDEHTSNRHSSGDHYSDKEFSDKDRSSRSKHQSRHHKHDTETGFGEQAAKGDDLSPIESSDNWMKVATKSRRRHERYAYKGRNRSPCPSELADPGNSGCSGDNSCERKSTRSTVRRHHRKREHRAMKRENGDSGSDGLDVGSVRSKQHPR
ncbi:hypothetical protein Taro_021562 [Colocasia esculenta]|uniref:C3H1-type domain-containing protein n=1 Tax=Colocasia esculenta TaxID=4460 RepID=A0A843URT6_COLES|nr:hypothetical protein [Colocasia esculenta]